MNEVSTHTWRRAFAMTLAVIPALLALYRLPGDDGLRHVALAFGPARSWGDVYPFSQFERFGDYDPWWGYDVALRGLGAALALMPGDRLVHQFVALKALSALFMGALLWLVTKRARITATLTDGYALVLATIVVSVALAESVSRFAAIRPFAFGTLLLVYSVGQRGALRGFLAAGLTTACYPYLAWMYVGAVVVAHVWRGSRSYALGAAAATLVGAAFRFEDLVGLVMELMRAGGVRAQLASTLQITEFRPLWEHWYSFLLVVPAALWLVPRLDRDARQLRTEHVMALCFLPIACAYARYFVDVVMPLLFVAHGADAMRHAREPFVRLCRRFRADDDAAPSPSTAVLAAPPRSSPVVRVALGVTYGSLVAALLMRSLEQYRTLVAVEPRLRDVPIGSLVLTEFNLQYALLHARPDLSLIPSSELGFARAEIVDAYVAYVNHGRVCSLADRTHANFLVDSPTHRLAEDDRDCLTLVHDDSHLRVWRVGNAEVPASNP